MKKIMYTIIISIFIILNTLPFVKANDLNLKVTIDNKPVSFTNGKPFVNNNRTMVPLRDISQVIGYSVTWMPSTNSVELTKGNNKVDVKVGSATITVNGTIKQMDVPILAVQGVTYVPVKFVGDAFGYNVSYDGNTQTVLLTSNQTAPIPQPSQPSNPPSPDLKVTIDNQQISFLNGKPFVNNNRTMVPLRDISEKTGYTVSWVSSTNSVEIAKGNNKIDLKIGSSAILVNGTSVQMDAPTVALNGATYIPVKFIAEALGYAVSYDGNSQTVQLTSNQNVTNPPSQSTEKIYNLELSRWGVYNDGTHAVETTKGFNNALQWANANGYTAFSVPEGTYLIDPNSTINMVSNMTFEPDSKAVFQEATNNLTGYIMFNLKRVHDVVMKGGTYLGDKLTHDYTNGAVLWQPNHDYKKGDKVVPPNTVGDNFTHYYVAQNDGTSGSTEPAWTWTILSKDNTVTWQPYAKNTNEGGYGIVTTGATNVTIDGVTSENFIGDGMAVGGANTYFQDYYQANFELGAIDDSGNPVSSSNTVRLKNITNLKDPRFAVSNTFTFGHQQGLPYEFNVYFYKADGTFLSSLKNQIVRKFIPIPKDAATARFTFQTTNLSNDYGEVWSMYPSTNILIENSEFAFNRRQGITVGEGNGVVIKNNKIHDQKGTDPQSGIDLEGGDFVLNNNIDINGNRFYNNARYDVVLYDGTNTTVENNNLGSKGAFGVAVSDPFNGATIKNNTFDGSRLLVYHDVSIIGNKMINGGIATLGGWNVSVNGMEFDNGAILGISPAFPYSVSVSNITMNNSSVGINVNPVHITNMTLNGGGFGGSVAGSIFDNLKVLNSPGSGLSPGTYNNCEFETVVANNGPHTSTDGTYVFNNCTFKGAGPGFSGANTDVTIKNSIFDQAGFNIAKAKNVDLENNTFTMNLTHNDLFHPSVIMIGGYWTKGSPYGVAKAVIKGNTIVSNDNAGGISTIFAGVGAPSYDIENNTLTKATLLLRDVDKNVANVIK